MAIDSNLIIVLQRLITHKAGKKAFLDMQTEKMQLSEAELKALADNPEFTESQKNAAITYAKTLHRNQVDNDAELQRLLSNFENSENSDVKLDSWHALADVMLNAYYVDTDSSVAFKVVSEVIEPLTIFATAYVDEFNGKLQNDKVFATKIVKLLFCIANFNQLADQSKICVQWYDKAEQFIHDNNLENTQEYADLFSLRGTEIARRFKPYNTDGSLNKFPKICVDYFQYALHLHAKIGSTLVTSPHMRDVQIRLAAVKVQSLQYQFESTNSQSADFKKHMKDATDEVFKLLYDLYPTLGLDGPRIAQCLQIESQLYLLQGELSKAVERATAAIPFVTEKQSEQRSNLLNKVGNTYVAMANVLYEIISNTESKFMSKLMADHPYTKLAHKLAYDYELKTASTQNLLSVADNFVVMATACYFNAYKLSNGTESFNHIYSEQAKTALKQIGIEEKILDLPYFQQPLEELLNDIMDSDKIPEVVVGTTSGPFSLTTMFTTKIQDGLNNFRDALMSVVYDPFASTLAAKSSSQQKPK